MREATGDYRPSCTCNFLLRVETAAKPKKASLTVQAGSYSVLVANFGSEQDSGVAQAVLSTGSCPAAASATAAAAGTGASAQQVTRSGAFRP